MIRRRSYLATTLTAVGLAMLMAGCSVNTAGGSGDNNKDLQTVTLGLTGFNPLHIVEIIAAKENLMAPSGVNLKTVIFSGVGQVASGLISGAVDFASTTPEQVMAAAQKEPSIKMVIGVVTGSPYTLVAKGDVNTVEDLRGKKISVNTAGVSNDSLTAQLMLDAHGLGKSDYSFVNTGSDTLTPVLAGATQAAEMLPPDIYTAQSKGLHILGKATDTPALKDPLVLDFASSQKWYQSHQDLAVKFVKGYQATVKWLLDPANQAKAVADLASQFKVSSDFAQKTYDYFYKGGLGVQKTGEIQLASLQAALRNDNQLVRQPPVVS